jgi:hypothetical protein
VGTILDEDRGMAMIRISSRNRNNSRNKNNDRDLSRNRLNNNRRGYTYLLVTTFIIGLLLMLFFSASRYKYQDFESLQQVRIRAMNDFVKNLDNDIHRATYISAFRAMLALEDHVTTTGLYLNNINSSFSETFYSGTINGTSSTIMTNSSFSDYLDNVREISESIGILLYINVTNIRIIQSDPWDMKVFMTLNISVIDSRNTASWSISKEYMTVIPITNLRDPLYSKNTFNRVPNTVRKLNYSTLVIGTNTSGLVEYINGSFYLASSAAPNFIMRFEGRTDPDPNGIESIVDIRALSDQDLPVDENRIKVDYIYFNNMTYVNGTVCNVQNVPSEYYFVVPSNRVGLYNITGLNYSTSCP